MQTYSPKEITRLLVAWSDGDESALAKDSEERYPTAREMGIDLKRLRRRLEIDGEFGQSVDGASEAAAMSGQAAVATMQEQNATPTSSLEFAVTEIRRHKTGFALVSVIVIIALVGAAFGIYKFSDRVQSERAAAPLKVTPLTTLPGVERSVAFSPDGKQVAFTWANDGSSHFDVYIKLIGAGEPLRLTTSLAREMSPAWAPDGRYIAFLRGTGEGKGYYIVPALGGAERKLTDAYGLGAARCPGPGYRLVARRTNAGPCGQTRRERAVMHLPAFGRDRRTT
jgi:hypothetical protein